MIRFKNDNYLSLYVQIVCVLILLLLKNANSLGDNVEQQDDDLFFEVIQPDDIQYTYRIKPAKNFGSSFNDTYKNMLLVPVQPDTGCEDIENKRYIYGNVALISRGECSFLTKVLNAEKSGAIAAIIMDNEKNDRLIEMIDDNTERLVTIPAGFLLWKDGYMIKRSIEMHDLDAAVINIPLNLTFKSVYKLKRPPWSLW